MIVELINWIIMIKYILLGIWGLLLLNSCENDDFVWGKEDFARIVGPEIWTRNTDSMTFTFSVYPEEVKEFAVASCVVIQGKVADYDRTVKLAVDPSKTTAQTSDYSLPREVILKAGQDSVGFDILLYRTEAMQTEEVRLQVKIDGSGDLQPGVDAWSALTIAWNDKITKPGNWEDLTEFFGDYSETKYRFIISTLGVSQFTYGEAEGMTWGEMWNYRLRMVAALEEYNATHSENMKDENGAVVSF